MIPITLVFTHLYFASFVYPHKPTHNLYIQGAKQIPQNSRIENIIKNNSKKHLANLK